MDEIRINNIDPILIEARRTAGLLRSSKLSRKKMLTLCRSLLADQKPANTLGKFWTTLRGLELSERYYWIGTFYTLLLSPKERTSQAAYFTPPHLANGLVEMVRKQGFEPVRHTAIDPAAGGASFLSTLAGVMIEAGLDSKTILSRLRGYEIDAALGGLCESLVGDRIGQEISKGTLVETRDSLLASPQVLYDLVIANPPYGRISSNDLSNETWRQVCHPGHINKYALFTELCFRLAKKDGLIALVLPSSFVAGPLYGRLRSFIRQKGEVLSLNGVMHRDDVFVDVAQDISVLLVKNGYAHRSEKMVAFGTYANAFKVTSSSSLPLDNEAPWISTVGSSHLHFGGAILADFGAKLRSGYFVWNREKQRMLKRRYRALDFPLIWAKNIRAGAFARPAARKRKGIDFVRFGDISNAVVRTDALVLQRTTNSAQHRRIIGARVSPNVVKKWGGFVTENHTIVLTGPSVQMLNALGVLLNSAAVDARYRLLSGTASVSVSLLRQLDLPRPECLITAIDKFGVTEAAVEEAYRLSASKIAEVGT